MRVQSPLYRAALRCAVVHSGYRYDHLDDAVAYARLQRSRSGYRQQPPAALRRTVEPPDTPQLATMVSLGITFRDGMYRFGPYRYDRLAHAVGYARLQLASGPAS